MMLKPLYVCTCTFVYFYWKVFCVLNISHSFSWMDGMIAGAQEAVNLILEEKYQELAQKYMEHLSIIFHGKTIA